jgi:MerR family transcriptional regulator/heat shock protein HspR
MGGEEHSSRMTQKFWTITEVKEVFEFEEELVLDLEKEEIVCPTFRDNDETKVFTISDMEKLRLIKLLYDDLGVNLPGIDIILRMRQNMIEMRSQFDAVLEDMARNIQEVLKDRR